MGVRRDTVTISFTTEVVQLFFGQPALGVSTAINAGRRMPLDVHHIAGEALGTPSEEMVKANVVEYRRRGIGRDVPTHA
ncbi:hypothetical protein D3C79_1012010 [compost metagenome]